MSNVTMTSPTAVIKAGPSTWHPSQANSLESQQSNDFVDIEAGHHTVFEDITQELSENDVVEQQRSRRNSFDFCVDLWNELEASAGEEHKKSPPEKEVWSEKVEVPEKVPQAHVRASRFRLSDYLPGFNSDADRDCEEV